jgi:mono/diheme cytochrome c family protein
MVSGLQHNDEAMEVVKVMKIQTWWIISPIVLLGCGDKGDSGGSDPISEIAALDGDATAGETVYTTNCAGCHGSSGEGGVGPALADVVPGSNVESLISIVYDGVGTMPAYGEVLVSQEIADLVAYLQANF